MLQSILSALPTATSETSAPARDQRGDSASSAEPAATRAGEGGFTLVELLVVIAILGLLISLVAPAMIRQLGNAKHKIAEQSVERLVGILDLYRIDVGSYPTTQQGLDALIKRPAGVTGWNGPYVKHDEDIRDPWGHTFEYRNPSPRAGHTFDISSLGADGKPGGDGEDADIVSR